MPPSKTGYLSLNVVIFPPVMHLVLDIQKRWPPPQIIDQIHELILEDSRISAKSIAEQLGISRERFGSIIHEDLDMRKLSAKWVLKYLNTDQKCQRCQSPEKLLEFFGAIQMIFCHDWWPWRKPGHIAMTWRQSNNQWSWGIAAQPVPKNSECKNPLEKFSPRFFGIKMASSLLIIFQRATLSTWSITHLRWCNWRTFWRKNAARGKVTKGVLFLHYNGPAHGALAYLGFQCPDHPPYSPDLAPSNYHLFPGLKKQLEGRHFLSDAEFIAAVETWLDGQPSEFFLSGLQKLE